MKLLTLLAALAVLFLAAGCGKTEVAPVPVGKMNEYKDPAKVEATRSAQKAALWNLAVKQRNPGPLIHYTQDYFSHHDYDNVRGHAVAGAQLAGSIIHRRLPRQLPGASQPVPGHAEGLVTLPFR